MSAPDLSAEERAVVARYCLNCSTMPDPDPRRVHPPANCPWRPETVRRPSPAAAGLPLEDVERVARALYDSMIWPLSLDVCRRLAAAALAEMRPTAAEEADRG